VLQRDSTRQSCKRRHHAVRGSRRERRARWRTSGVQQAANQHHAMTRHTRFIRRQSRTDPHVNTMTEGSTPRRKTDPDARNAKPSRPVKDGLHRIEGGHRRRDRRGGVREEPVRVLKRSAAAGDEGSRVTSSAPASSLSLRLQSARGDEEGSEASRASSRSGRPTTRGKVVTRDPVLGRRARTSGRRSSHDSLHTAYTC